MRTSRESPHAARVYWQKAQRFARAARRDLEAGDHDPAVSSAVNAVINVVDAVCVQYAGRRSASLDHGDAIRPLHHAPGLDAKVRDTLAKRLRGLLAVKSLAQYEGVLVTREEAATALQDMERALAAAAETAKRQGWTG